MQSKLLSIKEISTYLSVKESWVRSQIFQGKMPFIKIGHLIRFKVSEIEEWINNQSNGPSPPHLNYTLKKNNERH